MNGNKTNVIAWLDDIADKSDALQLAVIQCLAEGGPKTLTISKVNATPEWNLFVTGSPAVVEVFKEVDYAVLHDLYAAMENRATQLGLKVSFVFSGAALSPWPFTFQLPFSYVNEAGIYRYSYTCGQLVRLTDSYGVTHEVSISDGVIVIADGRGKSVIATVDLASTQVPVTPGDLVQQAVFSGSTTSVSVEIKPDGTPL